MSRRSWKAILILPVVFVGACTVVAGGVTQFLLVRSTEPVTSPPPPNFPVVAVTQEASGPRVWPLFHSDYEAFAQERPDHTFLIPVEAVDELRAQLVSMVRASSPDPGVRADYGIPWDADFEIEEAGPMEQLIRARLNRDDDTENIGWYRADERGYQPLEHRYAFGPSLALVGGIFGLLTGVFLVTLVKRKYGRWLYA